MINKMAGSDDDYLVLFFEDENKYDVVEVARCKNLCFETADANYSNQWYTGSIKCRGSKRKCEKKAAKYTKTGQFSTDEEATNTQTTPCNKSKVSNKRSRTKSHERTTASDNLQNELTKFMRLTNELSDNNNNVHTISANDEANSNHEELDNTIQPEILEDSGIRQPTDQNQILLMLQEINNKLNENHNNIIELRQNIIEIKSSIKSKNKPEKTWLTEVMHNGEDLLQVEESAYNKYVCTLMSKLYTKEELATGLVVLNEKSSTERKHLDVKKFETIKTATINKFKIVDGKQIKKILEIANRKCRDTELPKSN